MSGCSWFGRGDKEPERDPDDYLQARELPKLTIPPDLEAERVEDPFPIPPAAPQPQPRFYGSKPPMPDAIYGTEKWDEVRIQRLSGRRWLIAPEPPDVVWPKIKQFFADNGVQIAVEAPSRGRINTAWLSVTAGQGYRDVVRTLLVEARGKDNLTTGRDRFLIKLEQGVRARSSELHVRHENDAVEFPSPDGFDRLDALTSHAATAEQDMLSEIGAYIAAKVSEQVVSMVAQEIGSEPKAVLQRNPQGFPVLNLRLDYDRAWATVGQALENAEVEVTEADRSSGEFAVSLDENRVGEEKRRTLWARLNPFGGAGAPVRELKLRLSTAAPPSVEGFDVMVLSADDQPLDPEFSQQVLVLVKEFAG